MNKKQRLVLGEILRDYRIKNNLTLREVSDKVGKSHKSIQLYETGEVSISVETLIDISEVYNISAGDILNKLKNK